MFKWGSSIATAAVKGFTQAGTNSIADTDIDILSPIGANVKTGITLIVVYHKKHGEIRSGATYREFRLVDPLSPQVSKISGPDGIGIREVMIPMSVSSEIIITIDNAPRRIDLDPAEYIAKVGDMNLDITSAVVGEDRQARIYGNTFRLKEPGIQHGIVSFHGACDSTCCEDMTCAETCPTVKTACFALEFYDDTLPMLTVQTDTAGPRVGGDIIRLKIENFPFQDISVHYSMNIKDSTSTKSACKQWGAQVRKIWSSTLQHLLELQAI